MVVASEVVIVLCFFTGVVSLLCIPFLKQQ